MKNLPLVQLAALASALNLMASTKITAPDGAVFVFGDWSPPTVLPVKSDDGETQVVTRSRDVTRTFRRTEPTLKVDLVFHPSTAEVWLGQKDDRYVVCHRKIWGVTSRGGRLLSRLSQSAGDAVNGQELVLQQYLARLIQDGRAVVTLTIDGPRPLPYPQIQLTSDLRVWSSNLLDSPEGY